MKAEAAAEAAEAVDAEAAKSAPAAEEPRATSSRLPKQTGVRKRA